MRALGAAAVVLCELLTVISVTKLTTQELISRLKAVALLNIFCVFVTELTTQEPISPLKEVAS